MCIRDRSTDAEEEYPKVTSQTEDEVVIDFTDTEKLEETPPPVPEGKTEIKEMCIRDSSYSAKGTYGTTGAVDCQITVDSGIFRYADCFAIQHTQYLSLIHI